MDSCAAFWEGGCRVAELVNVRLEDLKLKGKSPCVLVAGKEGVRDRVELRGYFQHKELAEHLADAAAFVVPSLVTREGQRDGIPTVGVEAWLSRTPVIASLVGGMGEVIKNDETGLVFPPGDSDALAEAVIRLLNSPELQGTIVAGGHVPGRR